MTGGAEEGQADAGLKPEPVAALEDRHEAEVTADGKRNVKYPFAFKSLDWNAYHEYRPVYPDSLFSLWFEHHKSHGGSFDTAHDLGSGPGTAAAVLVNHFAKVIVSDAGAANLATAKANLVPPERFTFRQSPAEQASTWLAPQSVDLSSVCMAFHYMDGEATVRAIAATLKPGGSLVAVTYGFRLLFPGNPRAQELWCRATSRETLRLIREGRVFPAAIRGLARAMTGLDFVPLPTDLFEPGARRVYVNAAPDEPRPLYFVDSEPGLWEEAATHVGPSDVREYIRDPLWGRQADAAWLRGFLESCHLGYDDTTWAVEEWRELEAIVNAQPGGTIAVEWPVSVILATRKKED